MALQYAKNPDRLRQEVVNKMLPSKSKAEKVASIATGLLPVSFAIDILATLVGPFGGLLEIDAVWACASIRGAKTSHSVIKPLASTSETSDHNADRLTLGFTPSAPPPTETEIVEAIGCLPSKTGWAKNWENEAWGVSEVKEDLKSMMAKGARRWAEWCHALRKSQRRH